MEYFAQTVHNFSEKEANQNEDAKIHKVDSRNGLFAICDGAGGAGVFSKEWANFLVNSIPDDSRILFEDPQAWFVELSQRFYSEVIDKKDLSDLLLDKKVHRDGSYSTISVCWINEEQRKITLSSIGDSCCFYFTKQNKNEPFQLKHMTSLNEQNSLFENPNLVNWNNLDLPTFPKHEFQIENDYVVVLASDSLAKWLLTNIFVLQPDFFNVSNFNQSFLDSLVDARFGKVIESIKQSQSTFTINELIKKIHMITKSKNSFEAYIKELVDTNEIEKDDCTLILIGNAVS